MRHEPAAMSTKTTAGPGPTAVTMRSSRAPRSQPVFDTGVRKPRAPVICSAASMSAAAIDPWATTIPRSGSRAALLIVVLQVLAESALLLHPPDEPLVECRGHVHTGVAKQVHHRDHLGDHRDVLSGIERHDDLWHHDPEDVGLVMSEPAAVRILGRFPVLELHDHLDTLLLPYGTHPEQGGNIDQADPADLHVVARHLVSLADEDIGAPSGNLHDVVGDQAMTPLHEIEHALALSNPGTPDEQQADAVHVRQRAVEGGTRGESLLDERLDAPVELGGLEPRSQHRNPARLGELEHLRGDLQSLRDEDAWQLELEERLQRTAAGLRAERAEIGDLRFAEHVEPVGRETIGEAGKRKPGARGLRLRKRPVEPELPRQRFELERVAPAGDEVAKAKHQVRFTSGAWRALLKRPDARLAWRLRRSSARSSAVRWSGPAPRATSSSPCARCSRSSATHSTPSMSNSTVASMGRDATSATRAATTDACDRSVSGISQWRTVMVVFIPSSPAQRHAEPLMISRR